MSRILRRLPVSAFALLLLAVSARADAPAGDATVPDMVGLEAGAAQSIAKQGGFETTLVYGAQGAPGTIVSQEPSGLSVRPVGGTVTLQVAGGGGTPAQPPAQPPTPPVEPPTPVAPTPTAPPAGTGPSPIEPLPAPTVTPGTPSSAPAPPPPTEPVAPAVPSAIDIDALPVDPLPNTQGPPLPSVLGLTTDQAREKLAGWNVEVELIFASPDAVNRVVEQHPKPTSTLAQGETVAIVLGTAQAPGPEYRQVPLLVGLTAEEAVAALRKVGFEPVLRSAVGAPGDRGRVLLQTPKRFSFGVRGAGVKLTVGRGGLGGPAPTAPAPAAPSGPPAGVPEAPVAPTPVPPAPVPSEVPPTPPQGPAPEAPPTPPAPEPTPPPGPPPTPPRPAPGPVTLVGPADSENYPRAYGANFEWRTVPNADGYEWELQQEVGGGWRQARTEKLIGTKFRPARIEIGRYRWRVRALNGDTPGAWSDFRLLFFY